MISKCSRAGCVEAAESLIIWRNPRIHQENRTKIWAACKIHQEYLVDYLKQRDFFIETRANSKSPEFGEEL